MIRDRLEKYMATLARPRLLAALAKGVMPATEHLSIVQFVAPATLIDIGANKGQFSAIARHVNPKVAIHAFEPLASERARLQKILGPGDAALPYAVGEDKGMATFHVASRADSSSLHAPGEGQRQAYGVSAREAITVEVVHVQDHVDLAALKGPVLVKIDVQGAELSVLKSFGPHLRHVDFIYCEVSFVPLYEGQSLATEVCAYLFANGFVLRGAANLSNTALGPTQIDLLFARGMRTV